MAEEDDILADEAEYAAFKAGQEADEAEVQDLDRRSVEIARIEGDIAMLARMFPEAASTEEALAQWRAQIRDIKEPKRRWAEYEWFRRTADGIAFVKAKATESKAGDGGSPKPTVTAAAAVATEKLNITTRRADVEARKAARESEEKVDEKP